MIHYLKIIKKILPNFLYNFLKKVYHIFRYYNLLNPNYSSSDKITFGDLKTGNFLKDKILNASAYLEFGSGNTTIFASKNDIKYYSIESDRNFYFYLKKKDIKNIFFYSLGFVEFYSYPLFKSNIFKKIYKNKAKIYASEIFKKFSKNSILPDLILVDGRYRVLCMLNTFIYLKKNNLFKTCVILDDFKYREYYNIINIFFNVSLIGRLGVCYIKEDVPKENINDLINKYSYDER